MEKTFRYRNHLKVMYKFLLFVDLPVSLLITFFGFIYSTEIGIFFAFLTVYSFVMVFFYRRLVTTEVKLTDEEFSYGNCARKIVLKYSDILKIDSKSVRYTGGWLTVITAANKPIRLTLVIKNGGEMILLLKERMDALGLSDRYDEQKLTAYFRTATYGDQSWGRARFYFPLYFITLFLHSVLFVLFFVFSEMEIYSIWGYTVSVLLGLIPFLYVEYGIYAKQYKKMPKDAPWTIIPPNPQLDRKRLTIAYLIYLAFAIVSLTFQWLFL